MAEIKNIGNGASGIDNLRQAENGQDAARAGKFQGASANSVLPPTESPLEAGSSNQQQLSARRIEPPADSPISPAKTGDRGYRISGSPLEKPAAPSDDRILDYAMGGKDDSGVRAYLNQDPAAAKAIAAMRKGHAEIGSPDAEPLLDKAAENRINEIAKRLFDK